MKIQCPICKSSYNLPEAKLSGRVRQSVCRKCGANLVFINTGLQVPGDGEKPSSPPINLCPHCGLAHKDGLKCENCGSPLTPNQGQTGTSTEEEGIGEAVRKRPRMSLLKAAVAAAFLLLLAGLGIMAYFHFDKDTDPYCLSEQFIQKSPEISALVGNDPEIKRLPGGSVETSRTEGKAAFTVVVKGPAGSTRVHMAMTRTAGTWKILKADYKDRKGSLRSLIRVDEPGKPTGKTEIREKDPAVLALERQIDLGRGLYEGNRISEAIEAFEKAVEMDPDSAQAYLWRGKALTRAGREEAALKDLETAVDLDRNYYEAHDSLGKLYLKQGRYTASIGCFSECIRLQPRNGLAYYNRGYGFYRRGDRQHALKDAEKACRLGCRPGCKAYGNLKKELFKPR
jgi:tetratricopeptide (TPR) repeat protein